MKPFTTARLPRIVFGAGTVARVPAEVGGLGVRALIVTGARSFRGTPHWRALLDGLAGAGVAWQDLSVAGEPSPALVDEAVARHRGGAIDVVLGIGGGSAMDAAKAIAGLLPHGNSVMDHLEGVGRGIPYAGPALPLIAVPTTAGTGAEATMNAVLGQQGGGGFKKSFRHEALVPRVAVVDPDLLATCAPDLMAANGMDAFTQLLEAYVSLNANPVTDALAWSGLEAFQDGFFAAHDGGDAAPAGRSRLAYAALMSGVALAQAGLGSVHGLASPLGAYYPIPHGVVCGTLVAAATGANIDAFRAREPGADALGRYARVGALLAGGPLPGPDAALDALVRTLTQWTERLGLPRLGEFGINRGAIPKVVANCRGGSMKTNPIVLTDGEVADILLRRL